MNATRILRPVSRRSIKAVAALVLVSAASFGVGCNNGYEGAASGAALGALGGLAIGSLSGDMGKGAAIGAVVGGVGGAVLGDQNRRADDRSNHYRTDY